MLLGFGVCGVSDKISVGLKVRRVADCIEEGLSLPLPFPFAFVAVAFAFAFAACCSWRVAWRVVRGAWRVAHGAWRRGRLV